MSEKKTKKPAPVVYDDQPEEQTRSAPTRKAPPGPVNDLDDPKDERERLAAFDGEFSWKGTRLIALPISRKATFLQHRVAMGAPPLERVLADVDAFLLDALRIIYLCAVDPAEWIIDRGNAQALQTRMDAWADKHVLPGEEVSATLLGFQLYSASHRNRHDTAPSTSAPHGDDLGN
jgi:hypothetical protein